MTIRAWQGCWMAMVLVVAAGPVRLDAQPPTGL